MKFKFIPKRIGKIPIVLFLLLSCTEMDVKVPEKAAIEDELANARKVLSQKDLDSTTQAEKAIMHVTAVDPKTEMTARTEDDEERSPNYVLSATVTAESTYPGYSVQKIKD